ncbi:MAG: CysB family HTH-type transcriptional regulator [Proteobacteria bacterium]|nr:CysB family HTH-type transcriptional regulator [Pseudomonadota bacterium]MDA0861151.1 CysB family HTH-type transcriptional regulator [Pseudomonadota bacterium]MDA1030349.1 CysB family HTH-type transcriptional regulator [Pseudomonadota bacterium]
MKLQQLRFICEVAKHNLNLTKAANELFTSQPGISKQIKALEEELGVDIFIRRGKRFVGITEPGKEIINKSQAALSDLSNLKSIGSEYSNKTLGNLTIATTHTQARYALPPVIKQFREKYPEVRLSVYQGSPAHIVEMACSGEADLAIATEATSLTSELAMLPCYQWNRCVLTPPKHPLLKSKALSLEEICEYPIITYDFTFTGRPVIKQTFEAHGLKPDVVLTAIDADIIKTYVELGFGIGIVSMMAYDPARDTKIRAMDASHLFESSTTGIGIRKNSYMRGFVYDFISMFAPHLNREVIDSIVNKHGN